MIVNGKDQPVVVQARNLGRRFGDVEAVDGLDLDIGAGEIFGLVGPDGAGKTTALRLMTGLMLPSAGSVSVLGHDSVSEVESLRAHIGYMAQRFNLYPDLSVIENLSFFADVFGVEEPERGERIERLLGFARLDEFRDRRAGHLSGGMQKKLSLATTLVHQPKVLFLDEPTTGVDPVSRREFWEILTDLHLEGITIVVSTPYMDEAERCSRVCLVYGGQALVVATPDAVRDLPEGELLELRVGDALRPARQVVIDLPGVREVQTYGDRLHVFVDDAAARGDAIEAALSAEGIALAGMRPTRPRLEEAFISLIQARDREEMADA